MNDDHVSSIPTYVIANHQRHRTTYRQVDTG